MGPKWWARGRSPGTSCRPRPERPEAPAMRGQGKQAEEAEALKEGTMYQEESAPQKRRKNYTNSSLTRCKNWIHWLPTKNLRKKNLRNKNLLSCSLRTDLPLSGVSWRVQDTHQTCLVSVPLGPFRRQSPSWIRCWCEIDTCRCFQSQIETKSYTSNGRKDSRACWFLLLFVFFFF